MKFGKEDNGPQKDKVFKRHWKTKRSLIKAEENLVYQKIKLRKETKISYRENRDKNMENKLSGIEQTENKEQKKRGNCRKIVSENFPEQTECMKLLPKQGNKNKSIAANVL